MNSERWTRAVSVGAVVLLVIVLVIAALVGYYYLLPSSGGGTTLTPSAPPPNSNSTVSNTAPNSVSSQVTVASNSTSISSLLTTTVTSSKILTSTSASVTSVSSSSTASTQSASSSFHPILNGQFTGNVTSVRVSKVGVNLTTGAEILRSNVTLALIVNGVPVVYSFSEEPWNFSLMTGTTDQVLFTNGKLVDLQPDVNGLIQEHTHIILHLIIAGVPQNVPSGIGISGGTKANNGSQYIDSGIIGPIHTHDTSDIVHFEISIPHFNFTLGEMFAAWGYAFNSSCLWGHCASHASVHVYINSKTAYSGPDPEGLLVPPNVPANAPSNVTIVWTP